MNVISALTPKSESLADTVNTGTLAAEFSGTAVTVYGIPVNTGLLSFTSITVTKTASVSWLGDIAESSTCTISVYDGVVSLSMFAAMVEITPVAESISKVPAKDGKCGKSTFGN